MTTEGGDNVRCKAVWFQVGIVAALVAAVACGGGGTPTNPGGTGGGGGGGGGTGGGGGGAQSGATITIGTDGAVAPGQVTIGVGQGVTFTNNSNRTRNISSDPHPAHSDCPALGAVNLLGPGQSKTSNAFTTARTCGFHDHDDPDNASLKGSIVIR